MLQHKQPVAAGAERQPRIHLQRHIERFTLGGLLLTALLVGLVTLLPMYQHLREEIDQRTAFDTQLLSQTADNLLDRFENTAAQLSSRSEIRNALERYDDGRIGLDELRAFSVPRLQDALVHSPEIAGLVRLDARGEPVLSLRERIPAELWPLPAASGQRSERSVPVLLDGRIVLLIGTPILSREGRRLGTDIAAFRLEKLAGRLDAIPLHPATHSHLIHLGSGQVMHVQTPTPGLSEAPAACPLRGLLPRVGAGLDTESALPLGRDGRQLAFIRRLDGHPGWAVGLLIDRDRLYAVARTDLLWPLLGILLLTAGGGLLTWRVIRPLSRRLEAQARDLELAASVFECSNEGIVLMDAEQRVVSLNPAACCLTGYDEAALAGRPFGALVAAESSDVPFDSLLARVADSGHWLGEAPIRRADGSTFIARLSLAAVCDEELNAHHFMAAFADISKFKEEEARVHQLAYHDRLTGLPNRVLVQDRLQQALLKARRTGSQLALLFLDLDYFKQVNDSLGHAAGDHLLQAVARRLTDSVRASDTVARLGGDEFLILLEDIPGAEMAGNIAAKLVNALQSPFPIDGHEVRIGSSIGIALYPEHGEDAAHLVQSADAAMYRAKEGGRNRYVFHTGRRDAAVGA